MSPEKPSRNEEEYFAKLEAERLKKLRAEAAEAAEAAKRRQHFMKCPKCGADLAHEAYHGVEVDRCHACGGVWFDAGEVEQVLERHEAEGAGGLFHAIFQGVRAKAPPTGVKPDPA